MSEFNMARRNFLRHCIEAAPAVSMMFTGLVLAACGEEDSSSTKGDSCDTSGETATSISSNHQHTVDLTGLDTTDPAAVTLTLTTGNSHTHDVMLTKAMVSDIAGGLIVQVESASASGHSHRVIFNCVKESSSSGGGGY